MYSLPDLIYSYDSMEPYIDSKTMEVHHSKHHKTYVDNLNKAMEGHENWNNRPIEEVIKTLDQLPENIRMAVRNNGGGHYNHTLFWKMLNGGIDSQPSAELLSAVEKAFGGLEQFKDEFKKEALGRFGSGWAWLVVDENKSLSVYSTPNQDNPLTDGKTPILGIDVWEHAYYLKYQNRRAEYVDNWWNVVNWDYVSELYRG